MSDDIWCGLVPRFDKVLAIDFATILNGAQAVYYIDGYSQPIEVDYSTEEAAEVQKQWMQHLGVVEPDPPEPRSNTWESVHGPFVIDLTAVESIKCTTTTPGHQSIYGVDVVYKKNDSRLSDTAPVHIELVEDNWDDLKDRWHEELQYRESTRTTYVDPPRDEEAMLRVAALEGILCEIVCINSSDGSVVNGYQQEFNLLDALTTEAGEILVETLRRGNVDT